MDRSEILNFKEKLSENLSGDQIEIVLDQLITRAVYPIIRVSNIVDLVMAEMCHMLVMNQRRKLSCFNNNELLAILATYLATDDVAKKQAIYSSIKFERSISFFILTLFESMASSYIDNLKTYLFSKNKQERIAAETESAAIYNELRKGASKETFYHSIMESRYWTNLAFKFRSMIVEKYIRFTYNKSLRYKSGTGLNVDLDDLFKDLLLSVFKATDKYRSEKGPLLSSVEAWLKDGATHSATSHEYGVAYSIPTARRRSMIANNEVVNNFSISIDSESVLNEQDSSWVSSIVEDSHKAFLSRVAASADKYRVGFLELGLIYPLNETEKNQLRETLKAA